MASIHKRTIRWKTKKGEARSAVKYQARYVGDDGREHAKLFELKKDAQRWLNEQTAALVRGEWASPKAGKETLSSYAARWEKIQIGSDATLRIVDNALRLHILPRMGEQQLAKILRSDVQALVKQLETKGLSAGSVRNIYDVLVRVLDSAVEDKLIASSPCRRIALPKSHKGEAEIPELEDIERVRSQLDDRWRILPTFLAGTGVRIGEALGLTVDDVDFLRRTARVERQLLQSNKLAPLKTKSSQRTLPLGQVVIDELAAHLAKYPAGESLFIDEFGQPLTYRRWKRLIQDASKAAGVEITSHSFRHFAASALISGGASVKQVQMFLGHSSAVITLRIYSHLFPGDDDRTRNVLDAALSPLAEVSDSKRTVTASE